MKPTSRCTRRRFNYTGTILAAVMAATLKVLAEAGFDPLSRNQMGQAPMALL
jgi:hypothetical protein